ncbi:hypothetical protein D3C74_369270 [compost metagenome]
MDVRIGLPHPDGKYDSCFLRLRGYRKIPAHIVVVPCVSACAWKKDAEPGVLIALLVSSYAIGPRVRQVIGIRASVGFPFSPCISIYVESD